MGHLTNEQVLSKGPTPNELPPRDEENVALSKWTMTNAFAKHVAEKAWQILTKSFWEALFERIWPK